MPAAVANGERPRRRRCLVSSSEEAEGDGPGSASDAATGGIGEGAGPPDPTAGRDARAGGGPGGVGVEADVGSLGGPVVVVALRLEAWAVGGSPVVTGMGPVRAGRAAASLADRLDPRQPVVVSGVCGGLRDDVASGTVVVASAVGPADGPLRTLTGCDTVLDALDRAGIPAVAGVVVSTDRVVRGADRAALAATGAVAVDMESDAVVGRLGGRPLAVVRVVADTPQVGVVRGGVRALGVLRHLRPSLRAWAASLG